MIKNLSKLIAAAFAVLAIALPTTTPALAAPASSVQVAAAKKADKPAASPSPAASKKPAQARDAKGRFIKASAKPAAAASKKRAAAAS